MHLAQLRASQTLITMEIGYSSLRKHIIRVIREILHSRIYELCQRSTQFPVLSLGWLGSWHVARVRVGVFQLLERDSSLLARLYN